MKEQPHYLDLLTKEFFEEYYIKRKMSYPDIKNMLNEKGYNIHVGTLCKYAKRVDIGRNISEGRRIKSPNYLDYNKTYITESMVEYIDGFLLGDGNIGFNRKNPKCKLARFRCGVEYEDFCMYLMEPFKILGTKIKKVYSNKLNQGFIFDGCTQSHPDIYKQYLRWYPEVEVNVKYRIKQPPDDVKITPQSVLFWYLGDGSTVVKKGSIMTRLSTDGFTEEKNEMLVEKLKNKGIKCHRSLENRILIESRGIPAFFDFIGRDSPISCYNYKFDRIKEIANWRFESKRMKEVSEELNVSYDLLCYLVKTNKINCFRLSKKGRPRFLPEHIKQIKEYLNL